MNHLQQLLAEKYPDSEISHIERRAFEEGYKAAITRIVSSLPGKDDSGRPGCAYGDTEYDSESTVFGYNSAIEEVNNNIEKS